jgi:thiosulfate/3-mercaptopyruvate sulfurtransferase
MSIEGYSDCRHLTNCEALASHLKEITLIDLRPAEDFALGHIEGAKSLDIYGVSLNDSAVEPLQAFLCIFHSLFGARGVSRERPVVIYDHESGERAARAVWLLAVLDHPNVKLLDGGSQAWQTSGRPLVRIGEVSAPVAPEKAPPTPPPFAGGRRFEFLASRFDVDCAIDDDSVVIVDVRRQSEYEGTEKRARRVGTIPGAVHVFWRDHLDEYGALRPAETVRALYESKGVRPDKTVIAFCQGGYRSASTFLALTALGYPQVRNYIGSWGEWGSRDDSRITLPT